MCRCVVKGLFLSLSSSEKMFELILSMIMEEKEREREETMWYPTHYNCIKIESAPKKADRFFFARDIDNLWTAVSKIIGNVADGC